MKETTMDNLKWRTTTRCIIILDLLLTVTVVVMAGIAIYSYFAEIDVVEDHQSRALAALVFIGVTILASFVEMWSAFMLMMGTKLGEDSRLSLRRAKIYLVLNIALLIIVVITTGLMSSWIYFGVHTALRPLIIIVVLLFIHELNTTSSFDAVASRVNPEATF